MRSQVSVAFLLASALGLWLVAHSIPGSPPRLRAGAAGFFVSGSSVLRVSSGETSFFTAPTLLVGLKQSVVTLAKVEIALAAFSLQALPVEDRNVAACVCH